MTFRRATYLATGFWALVAASPVALAQGLSSQPVPGSIGPDGSLTLAVLVKNTGPTTVLVFADGAQQPSASDNNGHKWDRGIVTGIHFCESARTVSLCLADMNGWREKTERSATAIGPGDQATIEIAFGPPTEQIKRGEIFGDLYRLGLLVMVKHGGEWTSRSLGAANVPLRQHTR
jgi:hypothetical protein